MKTFPDVSTVMLFRELKLLEVAATPSTADVLYTRLPANVVMMPVLAVTFLT